MEFESYLNVSEEDLKGLLNGTQSIVLKVILKRGVNPPTPEEATEYISGCTSDKLRDILDYFHQRYPDEEVWPPGTKLSKGIKRLDLGGGTLPVGTVQPEGFKYFCLDGGTQPLGM